MTNSHDPTLPASEDSDALHVVDLGWLSVPNGELVLGDPFQGLDRRGNPSILIPPGRYRVLLTNLLENGEWKQAFLSLIISQSLLEDRQHWQKQRLLHDGDDLLPEHAISNPTDTDEPWFAASRSGALGIADAILFEQGMPHDNEEEGDSWYDVLFEHGVEGSWFDLLDAHQPTPTGTAMISLPRLSEDAHIAIAQPGIGQFRVFWEHAFNDTVVPENQGEIDEDLAELIDRMEPLVALHIDFNASPQGEF